MTIKILQKSRPLVTNENNFYSCPVCKAVVGKVFNIHNDGNYSLQCPNNKEHCNRMNDVSEFEAAPYKTIEEVQHCSVCNIVLAYTRDESYLVCPTDPSHQEPIETNSDEIEKLGYLPKN